MADTITGNPYEGMKRCILNPDLTVAYFCDPNNSNKKADGTTINWAQVGTLGQNLMVQIPKFYAAKKWVPTKNTWVFGASYEPVVTADLDLSDWKVHPAFFKDFSVACSVQGAQLAEVPFRYVGACVGWKDASGRMRSLPGKPARPTSESFGTPSYSNYSPVDILNAAEAMGVGFSPIDFYTWNMIVHLYICEYGNPDPSKTPVGYYTDATYATSLTMPSSIAALGNNSGLGCYRGMEQITGNLTACPNTGFPGTGHVLVGAGCLDQGLYAVPQGFYKSVATSGNIGQGIAAANGGLFALGRFVNLGKGYTTNIENELALGLLPRSLRTSPATSFSEINLGQYSNWHIIFSNAFTGFIPQCSNRKFTRLCI